jgi:hypothetical protein
MNKPLQLKHTMLMMMVLQRGFLYGTKGLVQIAVYIFSKYVLCNFASLIVLTDVHLLHFIIITL